MLPVAISDITTLPATEYVRDAHGPYNFGPQTSEKPGRFDQNLFKGITAGPLLVNSPAIIQGNMPSDPITRPEIDAKINASETRLAAEIRVLSGRLDNHMEMIHKDMQGLRTDFVAENKVTRKTAFWTALGLAVALLGAFIGLIAWQGNWIQTQNNLLMTTIVALHSTSPTAPAAHPAPPLSKQLP